MKAETPIRRQYLEIKAKHKDALLLFRLGDFYESFDDDARILAKELDIVLTSKPMGKDLRVPLAGIPHQFTRTPSCHAHFPRTSRSNLRTNFDQSNQRKRRQKID